MNNEMRVEVIDYFDRWQDVKNACMNTIGKEAGRYPTSDWKNKILLAEHSPIRLIELTICMYNIPYWVSVHLTRHKIGVEHFVSTQRTDRTGVKRDELPQGALVNHTMRINAQALINISRKRLCYQASPETRKLWSMVVAEVSKYEPELATVCVPNCLYRGFCPEMKPCGRFTDETAKFVLSESGWVYDVK